ncbi:MAG: hypothetical protein ABI831_09375 [Betaproteobacteria bacterium]
MFDWKLALAHDPGKEAYGQYKVKGISHLLIISRDGGDRKILQERLFVLV